MFRCTFYFIVYRNKLLLLDTDMPERRILLNFVHNPSSNRLIITGFKRPLQDSDLWSLDENNTADHIVPKLQREWEKELKKCRR